MDLIVVLILVLIIVLIWRGPKNIPELGAMFGRGVKAARQEADKMRSGSDTSKDDNRPSS